MKESVQKWLEEGDELDAARIFDQCTLDFLYVDTLFEMAGNREIELTDVNIGAPRKTISKVEAVASEEKIQIENAIRECAIAAQMQIRSITWVPLLVQQNNENIQEENEGLDFIDQTRINELETIQSDDFDLVKLIALCRELNLSYSKGSNFSVAMLTRAIMDHIPPIFGFNTFREILNNYATTRSFKESMEHLENSSNQNQE